MSFIKWCPILLLAVAGAACHPRPPAAALSRTTSSAPAVTARPPAPSRPPAAALDELNGERPLSDAFFDYDQNALREDARQVLQRDAEWLTKWPQTRVRVDGHCDERGTAEYNLALGERRAETVKEYLTSLGVRPDRIQTRSLGKEAPFCKDSGEPCWSQNRRGHLVITEK